MRTGCVTQTLHDHQGMAKPQLHPPTPETLGEHRRPDGVAFLVLERVPELRAAGRAGFDCHRSGLASRGC